MGSNDVSLFTEVNEQSTLNFQSDSLRNSKDTICNLVFKSIAAYETKSEMLFLKVLFGI